MSKPINVCAVSAPMPCYVCDKPRAYGYYIAKANDDPTTAVPLCEICAE